jgi:hypothetical protein
VVRAVRQEMSHFKTSNRDRDAWGERRTDPRSEVRVPLREPARANEGQGGVALKGTLLSISRRQGPRPLLHALRLMNLLLEKDLMGAAHVVCRGDIAFANAQTPLLYLGMIAVGGMENISRGVHRQLPKIGSALPTARALRVWLM